MQRTTPQIIVVGGGKGGVGKSSIAVGLAIAFAQAGKSTTIVDLDLGGANLHTLLGLKITEYGIGDFIYGNTGRKLSEFAVECGVENLRLISGNGFIPGIANLEHQRKLKVLRALEKLGTEYVVLDLGAGTSYNVIDFFSITESGIVVTLPEPAAILNAYEFLKNVIYRIFSQRFRKRAKVMNIINNFKRSNTAEKTEMEALIDAVAETDQTAAAEVRQVCQEFRPALILNMSRGASGNLGKSLGDICNTYLSISLSFLGDVTYDEAVRLAHVGMKPFLLASPDAESSCQLREIAAKCMEKDWLDKEFEQKISQDDEEDEAAGAPPAADGRAEMSELLKGHRESELPTLLGDFFTATRAEFGTPPPPAPAGTEAPAVPTAEAGAPPLHPDIPIEPRLDPKMKVPRFAVMEKKAVRPRSLWEKLFPWFGGHRQEEAVTSAVTQILKVVHSKNIPLAIQSLSNRPLRTPEVGAAWQEVGLQFVERGDFPLAQTAFANALNCLPTQPAVANNRAASLLATGLMEEAYDVLISGIEHGPGDLNLLFNLGLVNLAQERYEQAIGYFAKASPQKKPFSLEAEYLRAYALFKAGHYGESAKVYGQMADALPQSSEVRFNQGLAQLRSGQWPLAIKAFTSVLALAPQDAQALAARGLAHWNHKETAAAIADLSRAIQIQPADLSIRSARGLVCYLQGQYDIAITDIQTITELLPANIQFRRLLTEIRGKLSA